MSQRRLRVVLGKVGLDGHDRGVKVIARGLRDHGMEVIYTGLRRTAEELAEIALQEDADVVGLSILSGGSVELTREVKAELEARELDDVVLFVGGIISPAAAEQLRADGVAEVFGPGTTLEQIAEAISACAVPRG